MKKYILTHTTNKGIKTEKADTLEIATKAVINMHHPKAKFVCTDLVENDETGDQFRVYFVDKAEVYEFEIDATTNGVWSLFNQLAELRRSYDRFEITTITN